MSLLSHLYYKTIVIFLRVMNLSHALNSVISHANFPCQYTINRTYVRLVYNIPAQNELPPIFNRAHARSCLTRHLFIAIVNHTQRDVEDCRDGGGCIDFRHGSCFFLLFTAHIPLNSLFSFPALFFYSEETISLPATEAIALKRLRFVVYNAIFFLILTFSPSVWLFVAVSFLKHENE